MESEHITINKIRTPQLGLAADNVRCFCNLPQCVITGYMCKSQAGGCFSNFLDHFGHHSRDYRGRHGCLELLSDNEHRSFCQNSPGKVENISHKRKDSLIFCCYHDMCNHIDSPQTKHLIKNSTFFGQPTPGISNIQEPLDYSNSQVWFRAATIAVPVCGALILFLLIALAVKILRSENQNNSSRKLATVYHHHQDLHRIQLPLLIQNEIVSQKNETNARLNLMHDCSRDSASVIFKIEKNPPKCSEINLARSSERKYLDDEKICVKHPI